MPRTDHAIIFPLIGLLAAAFLLPEIYGYVEVRRRGAGDG